MLNDALSTLKFDINSCNLFHHVLEGASSAVSISMYVDGTSQCVSTPSNCCQLYYYSWRLRISFRGTRYTRFNRRASPHDTAVNFAAPLSGDAF